jgi:hypothetical protein
VILVGALGGNGGPEVMARMPRDFAAEPRQTIRLHYDATQMHVFDRDSGAALRRPAIA